MIWISKPIWLITENVCQLPSQGTTVRKGEGTWVSESPCGAEQFHHSWTTDLWTSVTGENRFLSYLIYRIQALPVTRTIYLINQLTNLISLDSFSVYLSQFLDKLPLANNNRVFFFLSNKHIMCSILVFGLIF